MEWVDKFQPGRVVGAELREAVGLPRDVPLDPDSEFQDCVPWFDGGRAEGSCGGMMFWGYPPGWVGPSSQCYQGFGIDATANLIDVLIPS